MCVKGNLEHGASTPTQRETHTYTRYEGEAVVLVRFRLCFSLFL